MCDVSGRCSWLALAAGSPLAVSCWQSYHERVLSADLWPGRCRRSAPAWCALAAGSSARARGRPPPLASRRPGARRSRRSWYGSCLWGSRVSPHFPARGTGPPSSAWPQLLPPWGWGQPPAELCSGVSMRPQVADCHLKGIASDAEHWHNWLERLAELRRTNEGDAAQLDRPPKHRNCEPLVRILL
jgi:hypothetical protein